MLPNLFNTKLALPARRANRVLREHLLERLRQAERARVILVSAPAGFGKTTLVGEWIQNVRTFERGDVETLIAWVSLEESDNDPVRFWTYVAAAFNRVLEGSADSLLKQLKGLQFPFSPEILAEFINSLSNHPRLTLQPGESQAASLRLVLDDYHWIVNEAVHDSLRFFLDHLPAQIQLVLVSRVDPPFPLGRLRANGQLAELRAADLRFSLDEAAQFLNPLMGLNLGFEDITRLETRTEGWIAGLQLAALALQSMSTAQSSGQVEQFIAAFTGSHRHVVDYLIEEVFQRQPVEVQNFLLQTSILERLTGSLCNALTGRQDGEAMLDRLERENLFLIPLDAGRCWYRYHHLFAELLRYRLQLASPAWIQDHGDASVLNRKAAEWYRNQGWTNEAIRHALAASKFDLAAGMMEAVCESMWMGGEMVTLLGWIEALPEEILFAHIRLSAVQALVFVLMGHSGQWSKATTQLAGLQQRYAQAPLDEASAQAHEDYRDLYGILMAVRSILATLSGDIITATDLSRQALELLRESNLIWRGVALVSFGHAHDWQGESLKARAAYDRALQVNQRAGNRHLALRCMIWRGKQEFQLGHFQQAHQTFQDVLAQAKAYGDVFQPAIAGAYFYPAQILHEQNRLEEAQQAAAHSLELGERWDNLGVSLYSRITLALVKLAQGENQAARDTLDSALDLARQREGERRFIMDIEAILARCRLANGELGQAAAWADRLALPDEPEFVFHESYISLVYIEIARENADKALALLTRLKEKDEAAGRLLYLVRDWALEALAWQAAGEQAQALKALERALQLGEDEDFVRSFVDAGQPMAALLREAVTSGVCPNYAARLLAEFPLENSPDPRFQQDVQKKVEVLNLKSTMIEPLTLRELEVLRLIGEGYSNREIALKLYLTVNTVKVHIKNIYGKLDVESRAQAIRKSRELGIM